MPRLDRKIMTRVSPVQRETLQRMVETSKPLIKMLGDCWTTEGTDPQLWRVRTGTVLAMIDSGWIKQANPAEFDTGEMILTETGREIGEQAIAQSRAELTARIIQYSMMGYDADRIVQSFGIPESTVKAVFNAIATQQNA